jgi:phosphoadenosine phosphosulfate reductase
MKLNHNLEHYLERIDGQHRVFKERLLYSIRLLQKAAKLAEMYDPDNGYYLAFSGGKDSQALLHVAELAGVKFAAHMNLTSVDPPEVIRFVRQQYPEVELIKPKDSIYNIAVKKGMLPTQRIRWCCEEFKENAGAGKVTLIGIRHAESTRRAQRNEVEVSNKQFSGNLESFEEFREKRMLNNKVKKIKLPKPSVANLDDVNQEQITGCITGKESILISPIIRWSESDVWYFLNEVVQVPHCSLYDSGLHRIGCIGCPMSNYKQKIKELELYPHVKRNWLKAIRRIRRGGISKHQYIRQLHYGEGAVTCLWSTHQGRPQGFWVRPLRTRALI